MAHMPDFPRITQVMHYHGLNINYYTHVMASFQDQLGKAGTRMLNHSDSAAARDDTWNCMTCKSFATSCSQTVTTSSIPTLNFLHVTHETVSKYWSKI